MDAFEIVALIFLILGTACMVVGTALIWRALVAQTKWTGKETQSFEYDTFVFYYAFIVAWIHFLTKPYDPYGRAVWRYIFYGLFFFAAVSSWNSWLNTDTNRHYYNDVDPADLYGEEYGNKRAFAGEIICYAGFFMLLLSIHGAFRYTSAITIVLFLLTIAFNIIGSIILWNLDSTDIYPESENTIVDRVDAFYVAVSMWITIAVMSGGVFHEYRDGALAAAFALGYFGLWYLSRAFILRQNNSGEDVDRAWAGSLFCWFSAWAGILTARFAAAVPVEIPTMA